MFVTTKAGRNGAEHGGLRSQGMCLPHLPATAEAASRKKVAPAPRVQTTLQSPCWAGCVDAAGSNPREAEERQPADCTRAGAALGLCPREGLHPQHQDRRVL